MTPLFLDTSYLIAVESTDDQYHKAASAHWRSLLKSPRRLVTSSYVLVEVVTLLNNRRSHSKAVELGNNLLSSRLFSVVHVSEELFYEAWRYFQKYKDKRYSLTDCVSFVLMNKLGIEEALTFDKHFAQAGLRKLP
ncbi:MAG TPA: PIN domain-containing protein [Pyrinomonadaceae bacterium]|nr:PIN domain-containing protein [Pyrinomonadaceae bacterium]